MAKAKGGSGAGWTVAALAAAAAGAYYFYGKNGAKHRRTLSGWAVKARGEVMERVEGLGEVTEKNYHSAVDTVLKGYKKLKNVAPEELSALSEELKGHWSGIRKDLLKAAKNTVVKTASKKKK